MIQKAYVHNILVTFGMKNCILATTSMDKKLNIKVDIKEKEVEVDSI